jgi:hypothetical protein
MKRVFVNAYFRFWNGSATMVRAHWRRWPKSRKTTSLKGHAALAH